jgi:hypothetical protein
VEGVRRVAVEFWRWRWGSVIFARFTASTPSTYAGGGVRDISRGRMHGWMEENEPRHSLWFVFVTHCMGLALRCQAWFLFGVKFNPRRRTTL